MTSAEIAQRLGIKVRTFYRKRHRLQLLDGMPPALDHTRRTWDRLRMEAWLTRGQTLQADNDQSPLVTAGATDAQWREHLERIYCGASS